MSCLFAESVVISGRVRNNENKPIEFATVRIGATHTGANTDIDGRYSLTVNYSDTINVVFSCMGYKTVTHRLIKPEGELTLNVKLYPDMHQLDEVKVEGFRNRSDGMLSLRKGSYENSPDVSGGSVESFISTMPGVNSSNELSSQYSVRGGSFNENSVYINGMQIYRPLLIRNGQQEGLSVINPDMVGNILFSAGGFPARYDDRMSSVLDIRYRDPKELEGKISLSTRGGMFSFGMNKGRVSMLHGFRLRRNNSLLASQETKGEYDPRFVDYQTNIIFHGSDRFNISFLGNIAANTFNFQPKDRETSFGTMDNIKNFKVYFDGREKDRFDTYSGSLSLSYRKSRNTAFDVILSAFHTNESVNYDISGEYWLDQTGESSIKDNVAVPGIGRYMEHARDRLTASVLSAIFRGSARVGNNNILYGISVAREKFHDRIREWEWRDSAGFSLPSLPEGVHLYYNLLSRENLVTNRVAVYAEDGMEFDTERARVSMNAGVRLSYMDFNREWLVSPRLNINISPRGHNNMVYRIAAGLFYQTPFYKEYRKITEDESGNAEVRLNRDIKSPGSVQLLLGTDYVFNALNRPFKLTGEIYYKSVFNFISYEIDNLKVTYSGENDSKGYIAGADLKLFGQFVPGSDSWISVSLMKTRQTVGGAKVPFPSDCRYAFNLFFTDYFPKFPKLKFSLRGVLSDGLTMTAPRVQRGKGWFRSPSYKRVDIGLTYDLIGDNGYDSVSHVSRRKVLKKLTLGADVFNLFDISNVSSYYWVSDVSNHQYAIPNYLTRRQLNFRISALF